MAQYIEDDGWTSEQRKAILARVPWVMRAPSGETFGRCEEITVRKSQCAWQAQWMFSPLPFHNKWSSIKGPKRMCLHHLIYRGIYGTMDEHARITRWLRLAKQRQWFRKIIN